MFDEVKDSGYREEFDSGSRRDTQDGKGCFDLIPGYPMLRLAQHYQNGAKKYGPHNWSKGQPISRYFSSAMRHLYKWLMGYREEDHLSAAVWNIFCIIDHEERIRLGYLDPKFDDMGETPRYVPLNEEGDCK